MIHVLAKRDSRSIEDTLDRLGATGPLAETLIRIESQSRRLAHWWAKSTSTPLYQVASADWPLEREAFLRQAGIEPSRLSIDALCGSVVVGDRGRRPLWPASVTRLDPGSRLVRPAAHLLLSSAPGRPVGFVEIYVNNRGEIIHSVKCVAKAAVPVWCGCPDAAGSYLVSDPMEHLRLVSTGVPCLFSPSPAETSRLLGTPIGPDEGAWYDVSGLPVERYGAPTPPALKTLERAGTTFACRNRFWQVRNNRLLDVSGVVVWPTVYRILRVVVCGPRERWLRIADNDRFEWLREEQFRPWLRDRLPRANNLCDVVVAAAHMISTPTTVRSERRLGWDEGCRGFGVPGGLVSGGMFEAQPWRGKPPVSGYPGRWSVEMAGVSLAERLATGALARRWLSTLTGKPLCPSEQRFVRSRPDRTRRLVGFLLWLTASADRMVKAEAGVPGLFEEWLWSERGLPAPVYQSGKKLPTLSVVG